MQINVKIFMNRYIYQENYVYLQIIFNTGSMKKILFTLLAVSILASAGAQTAKCGIDTKALVKEELAAGAHTISFLAKMAPGADMAALEKAGIVFGAQAGDIVTMLVPVESLDLLESSKDVLQYSISHKIAMPDCDNMRFDTRTDKVQNGIGVDGDTSYNGEGVYIGITDWGFDYTNLNYNNQGAFNRRIDRAWDHFRLAGPAPDGFTYGTEIIGYQDLRAAKGDTSNLYNYGTHGTHVAGIAAGYGLREKYRGQAPKARLLLCSFGLGEAEWMDGVAWMKQVAQDSSRRLVVNSSWGMYSFSCIDGKSLLSQAINNWSDEGVVFCTSAGNNGDVNFHISRNFSETHDTLKTVASYYQSNESPGNCLIMWGQEGHDFAARICYKSGQSVWSSPLFNTANGDSIIDDSVNCNGTYVKYRVLIEHINPFDSRPHIQIDANKNTAMELQLHIIADNGTVHAWNVCNLRNHAGNMGCDFTNGNRGGFVGGDKLYGIGEPACAAKCISVAAHSSEHLASDSVTITGGYITTFSSYGPLIDGTQKPEISAPGQNVVSSISPWCDNFDSYMPIMSQTIQGVQYIWAAMSGTSMSCPSVTGITALILQANPLLSTNQVRDIIISNARNDSYTGPLRERDSTSLRWGYGKIDALACVNDAMHRVSIHEAEELRLPLHVYPNPTTSFVNIATGCGDRVTMTVYSVDGRTVLQRDVQDSTTIDVAGWNQGIYIIKVGGRTAKMVVK